MQPVELLNSCSRTVTVHRISAGQGVRAYQVETSAFPDYHPQWAAAVDLPEPSPDAAFTPLFSDGIKQPEFFIGDGDEEQQKICSVCQCPLLDLETGESVQLRQMMCHQQDAGGQCRPLAWTPPRDHYFPCVFHARCAEQWFTPPQSLCPAGCGWRFDIFGQAVHPFPQFALHQPLPNPVAHFPPPPHSHPPPPPPPPEALSVHDIQALVDARLVEDPAADALDLSPEWTSAKIDNLQGVNFPPAFKLLRFDGNNIELLQGIAFPHTLEFLILSSNKISALPPTLDVLLPNLALLNLAHNRMHSLQGVVFPTTLKVLKLDFNQIATLQGANFPQALESLMLSNNTLASLQHVTFPPTLQELKVDCNAITTLQDVEFPPALQILTLGGNRIESPGAQVVFPDTMQRLDLSGNRITHMQGFMLRASSAVQYLNLGGNRIQHLHDYDFPQSLKFLGLRSNPIALVGNAIDILAPPGCSVFIMSTPALLKNLSAEKVADLATRRAGIVPPDDFFCVQAIVESGVRSVSYREDWTRDLLRGCLETVEFFRANAGHCDRVIEALVAMAHDADSNCHGEYEAAAPAL